jgi:hypothetical protein
MFRLDYISCLLTIASTVMIGRRLWHGWIVAGANSAVICYIGVRTAQTGFVPANLFCIAMYGYNIVQWRKSAVTKPAPQEQMVVREERTTLESRSEEETSTPAYWAKPPADTVAEYRRPRRVKTKSTQFNRRADTHCRSNASVRVASAVSPRPKAPRRRQ